jgi:small subunit ribosomal protein S9
MECKGLGRRKTSVARVIVRRGNGTITVNGKTPKNYFPYDLIIQSMVQPLEAIGKMDKYDVTAKVEGGGFTGQAGAIRLAITRALIAEDANIKPELKKLSLTTRDARVKERKKFGKYGARRSPQFTKR